VSVNPKAEFLVLSRGKWDPSLPPETIQDAIDRFYAWYESCLAAGTMKPGQRLAREGRIVSRNSITDGPFVETKELIGGYWFIVAESLEEAARLAARNPCLACGIELEIRPVDPEKASAFEVTCETPARDAGDARRG
jgi:hypothetical protein